ncbi:MAG: hypothetical protein HeimC2_00510 [Candidatus Heimdallarchaeota archaeon LC_2]|nr:MAG: hypothetical protein HeimC2_00510 [Candidatus Heimdallarchaeota archaeon LC_2]
MKAEDKYGRPIYKYIFSTLEKFGKSLINLNYKESKQKPNLFYRVLPNGGVIFADMRGTEIVPIWEDPRPMIYWKLDELRGIVDAKTAQVLIQNEFLRYKKFNIKFRLSYEFTMHPPWPFDSHSIYVEGDDDYDTVHILNSRVNNPHSEIISNTKINKRKFKSRCRKTHMLKQVNSVSRNESEKIDSHIEGFKFPQFYCGLQHRLNVKSTPIYTYDFQNTTCETCKASYNASLRAFRDDKNKKITKVGQKNQPRFLKGVTVGGQRIVKNNISVKEAYKFKNNVMKK